MAIDLTTAEYYIMEELKEQLDAGFTDGANHTGQPVPYIPKMGGYSDFQAEIQTVVQQVNLLPFACFLKAMNGGAGMPWTPVTLFSGGWGNAAGYQSTGYRVEGGRVFLRGSISGGSSGAMAFSLAAGNHPPDKVAMAAGGLLSGAPVPATIIIYPDGTLEVYCQPGSVVSLDGLSFAL